MNWVASYEQNPGCCEYHLGPPPWDLFILAESARVKTLAQPYAVVREIVECLYNPGDLSDNTVLQNHGKARSLQNMVSKIRLVLVSCSCSHFPACTIRMLAFMKGLLQVHTVLSPFVAHCVVSIHGTLSCLHS
eukprot:scpid109145/ scgid17105/ 